ncbi:hypothetical protein NMY22_g19195 [Coprinellus aureogranulatus]|nr:hypothetical protein NMY22_g19195 [Coprinellus aureogranulatus]
MGARESTARGGEEGEAVVDYYKILEVAEDATADEIKVSTHSIGVDLQLNSIEQKSFRRLALIHHPDKNHDNQEEATKKFATLQQAYEVLSDEQERAWYDSHKTSLVPEADGDAVFEDIRSGKAPPRTRDRGLTARHLARFFDVSIYKGYGDDDNSFFTIYRNLFDRLASEENMLNPYMEYPSFGYSTWPFTTEMKKRTGADGAAREFYSVWQTLSPRRSSAGRTNGARQTPPIGGAMEKENKTAREDARREYNDIVRSLVKFIRRRDPRFQRQQKELDEIAKSKATASNSNSTPTPPAAPAAEYVEQEWQKVDPKAHGHADLDWGVAENENDEEWECVACGKSFRTEAAWDSHERSKKHLKAIEQLRRDMEMDDEALELQGEEGSDGEEPPLSDEDDQEDSVEAPVIETDGEVEPELEGEGKVDEDGVSEEEDDQRDSWDCAACNKSFKSKAAWESHERNKAHQKAMREHLKAQRSRTSSAKPSKASTPRPQSPDPSWMAAVADEAPATAKPRSKKAKGRAPPQPELDDEDDGMPLSKTERKARRKAKLAEFSETQSQGPSQVTSGISTPQRPMQEEQENGTVPENSADPQIPEIAGISKKAKRKEKEKAKSAASESFQCNVCRESFPSKTKLFNHINEEGHAAAVPEKGGGKKATKGKRR